MAVEISGVTLCPSDDLITAAYLDYPRTGPVDGYAFEVNGWVVSKAPVAEVEFVHEQSVVASCELTVSRPDVAKVYGSSSQVGFSEGDRNGRPRTGLHHWGEGCLPGWTPTRDRGNTRHAIKTTGGGPSARL